ncbi:MAG: hypothetical protein ACTFAK_02450 [Candidatus Electronema sp. VV]
MNFEKMPIVISMEIREYILVAFELKIFAANFDSDHFLICQGRLKAVMPYPAVLFDKIILFVGDQKTVPIKLS